MTSSVKLAGAAATAALLAACGGGGGAVANDITVILTTQGGQQQVEPGTSLGIRAQVDNASNAAVTWKLEGGPPGGTCPGQCGEFTATSDSGATYRAPSPNASQFTVTVTATSVQDTKKSGSVVLTVPAKVCPASAGLLSGQYAFLLQGFDVASEDGVAAVGSMNADGCGTITSGTLDYYLGPASSGSVLNLTGTYTVGNDSRGSIQLGVGKTFLIALGKVSAGVATQGALTEDNPFNTGTILSGTLVRQDDAGFSQASIAGNYAYLLNGWQGAGQRWAVAGTVLADGAGHLSSGLQDGEFYLGDGVTHLFDFGLQWSGSYGAVDAASGRVALLLSDNASAVGYLVTAGQLFVLVADPTAGQGAGQVLSGRILAQSGTFGLGSLDGTLVHLSAANYTSPSYPTYTRTALGLSEADGNGNLTTLALDLNSGGNISYTATPTAYTYTVDAASGQATLWLNNASVARLYLTAPNTAFYLGFDPWATIAQFYPQTATAPAAGAYLLRGLPGGSCTSTAISGVATAASLALSTTTDSNTEGAMSKDVTASTTLTCDAHGRCLDTGRSTVYYAVSPTLFFSMDLRSSTTSPIIVEYER